MRLIKRLKLASLAGLFEAVAAYPAMAVTFNATEISYDKALLSQFNLINLGALTTSASTDGRVLVGGSVTSSTGAVACAAAACTGNSTLGSTSGPAAGVVTAGSSSPAYGALTVFGSITGSYATRSGDIDVGGNIGGGTLNLNGRGVLNVVGNGLNAGALGSTVVNSPTAIRDASALFLGTVSNNPGGVTTATAASVFPFGSSATANIATPLKNLSAGLAALPGTPNVTAQSLPSNASSVFVAGTSIVAVSTDGLTTKRYGVVTTTLANLASAGSSVSISGGSNDATFVLVTGDGANTLLPTLNGSSNVIYDFVDATTLKFAGGINASILAPLATITQQGGTFNGTFVVQSMSQTAALQQGNAFTGDLSGLSLTFTRVPEPSSLVIVGGSLLGAVLLRASRIFGRRPTPGLPRPTAWPRYGGIPPATRPETDSPRECEARRRPRPR